MLDLLAFEPEGEGDAAAVEGLDAGGGVDVEGQDFLGRVMRDILDVHAAFGGADKADAAGLPVDQQREIEFARDVAAVLDIDAVDLLACGAGLDRDQRAAQHLRGLGRGLAHRPGDADAALFTRRGLDELALAAPACVDLAFHDPDRPVDLARRRLGVFGAGDDAAIGNRDAVLAQKSLGLVFVYVHGIDPIRFPRL